MLKKLLLGSVAAAAISSTALAADAVVEAPAPPPQAVEAAPVFSWAGGYVGAFGGYGWGNGDFYDGVGSASDDFDGGRFGGFAGWNFDVGSNIIVGVEGDLNSDWNENSYGDVDVKTGLNGSVRGRVGYAMDRALLYAAGGWTATNFSVDGPGFGEDKMLNGWTLGAGFDYAVTDQLFTRVEYRYNDYAEKNILGVDTDFNQHVVNVGLGLKF